MSAISATAALPPRRQHPHIFDPRRAMKEAPPEVIEYESRHQRRPIGPLAAPGSHGSAIGDARRDLRISSTPANPESAMIVQHRTGLSLSKLSGNNPNNPEAHLWCTPSSAQGKNRRPAGTMTVVVAAAGELKLPLQSPVRLVQWWRRPPSPLVSLERPLWKSITGDDRLVANAPTDMKKGSRRAPEEGEEAVEEGRPLTRGGGSQEPKIKPTPTEVSPEPEPEQEPLMTGTSMGTTFSALSPDSTFSTSEPSARGPARGGSWSRLMGTAPPPPTMNAPTAASAAAAAAAGAAGVAIQAPYTKDYRREERSPSGSPESARPGSMRWEGAHEDAPPPPIGTPPRPGVHRAAAATVHKAASRQSRPAQDLRFGGGAAAAEGGSGRGASSSGGGGHGSRGTAISVDVNGRRTSSPMVEGSARRTLLARLSRPESGGDVVPEDSTIKAASAGPPPSMGDFAVPEGTVPSSRTKGTRSAQGAARRSTKPALAAPAGLQATTGADSDDNNGRGSPPPHLEGLAVGGSKGKSVDRLQANGGHGRPESVVVFRKNGSREGGGGVGGSLPGTLAAGLAVAISEMEKAENTRHAGRDGRRDGAAAGKNRDTGTGSADVGGGALGGLPRSGRERVTRGRARSPSRGRAQPTGARGGEWKEHDGGATDGGGSEGVVARRSAAQPSRVGYLSNGSSTLEAPRVRSHRVQARVVPVASTVQAKATVVDPSSSDEESEDLMERRRSSSSSSASAFSDSTTFTAASASTAWTLQAPSEAAPPSEAGPATPDSLLASDANGPRSLLALSEGALGVHVAGAEVAAPPSPTSSHASSSLATSMKNPSRRRRRSGTVSISKGTRPERETGAAMRSSHHLRRGYQRRRTPPSAESPLSVGAGTARAVAQNRRRPRMNTSGMVGVPMQGIGGAGGAAVTGGIGNSSGGVRLDDRGLRLMARGDDEAYERHYVNPMNAQAGAISSAAGFTEVPEDQKSKISGGALAKLLRRLNVLRKRWRLKRKNDAEADYEDGEAASSAASEGENDDDFRRKSSTRSTGGGQRDGPSEDDLEMACRRMLDALWMSAKRGTDTLSISVADGRTLLNGLMATRGDKDGRIDLGVPLPVVKGKKASQQGKPLRPVVGGASGPFARAGRGRDTSTGESESGSRRRQAVALMRAMELAMGVSEDTVGRTGSGHTKAIESADGFQSPADWSAATNRAGMDPSDSRHHARRSLSRAKLHRELRKESAAVSLAAGGDINNIDGASSMASSSVSSSRGITSNGHLHRASHHRRTGSDGSGESRGGASEVSSVVRPGSSRPHEYALAGAVASGGGGNGDAPSSRGGYSDDESERSSRSQRPGSSSTRRGSDGSGMGRSRADNVRREYRASDRLEVVRPAVSGGRRPVEGFVDGSVSSRSRSRSSSRPAAARKPVNGSAGSSRSNEGGFGGGAADGEAGGHSSRIRVDRRDRNISEERRNYGPSADARFDDRRRPRSQPLPKQD